MFPGQVYHLYTHANGGENLFREEKNYSFFLKKYQIFIGSVADTYSYSLLPNHVHLMIRIKEEIELLKVLNPVNVKKSIEFAISRQFASLFSSYTQSFNKMFNRMGSLFIPNFRQKEVNNDSYFTALILYIHLNAVKHGICSSLSEWPWSSYWPILNNDSDLFHSEIILDWFGGRQEFIKEHEILQKLLTLQKFGNFGELKAFGEFDF